MTQLIFARRKLIGGEGGIRTLGEITPTLPFQGSSIGRSDTSPVNSFIDPGQQKGVEVTLMLEK